MGHVDEYTQVGLASLLPLTSTQLTLRRADSAFPADKLLPYSHPLSPLLFLSYFSEPVVRAVPLKVSSSWPDGAVTEPPARPHAQGPLHDLGICSNAFNFSQQSPLSLIACMQLRSPCSLSSHGLHPLNSLDFREEDQLAR